MTREWQPGDVIAARNGGWKGRLLRRHGGDWVDQDGEVMDGSDLREIRPLIVIDLDPQTDLYLQSDGRDMTVWRDDEALLTEKQAGEALWAHLVATLPTRDEPQDEPTDPGVRVVDADGDEWARLGDMWVSDYDRAGWSDLLRCGPVKIVQPDAPSADERPFKVGETVTINRDGLMMSGQTGRYEGAASVGPGASVRIAGVVYAIPYVRLTHADAPC